jgi:hypothetical protein
MFDWFVCPNIKEIVDIFLQNTSDDGDSVASLCTPKHGKKKQGDGFDTPTTHGEEPDDCEMTPGGKEESTLLGIPGIEQFLRDLLPRDMKFLVAGKDVSDETSQKKLFM